MTGLKYYVLSHTADYGLLAIQGGYLWGRKYCNRTLCLQCRKACRDIGLIGAVVVGDLRLEPERRKASAAVGMFFDSWFTWSSISIPTFGPKPSIGL